MQCVGLQVDDLQVGLLVIQSYSLERCTQLPDVSNAVGGCVLLRTEFPRRLLQLYLELSSCSFVPYLSENRINKVTENEGQGAQCVARDALALLRHELLQLPRHT